MNRTKNALIAVVAAATLSLAACGPSQSSEGDGGASASDTVVLYTGQTATSPFLVEKYEELTGNKLVVITGSSGELFSRVQSEAGNPQGDVYWLPGLLPSQHPELFELYKSSSFDQINPAFVSDIEPQPVSGFLYCIGYNTDLVGDDIPTSYFDLADPKWKGKIYMADPVQSTVAYATITFIREAGGWELVEEVAKNIVISDNFAGPRAVNDGEAAIYLGNEVAMYSYISNPSIGISYPEEGVASGWESLFLIKGGPNPEGAKKFIDWFLSDEGQTVVAEDLPGLRPSFLNAPEPAGLPPIDEINVLPMPEDAIANKEAHLQKWEEIITNI